MMTGSVGLLSDALASLINLVVGSVLLRAGKRHRSITLEADAHHLLTDVWTSAGVIVGLTAVALTGWLCLDPTLALLVATNIVWTGWGLLQRSAVGLMDGSLPPEEHALVLAILERYRAQGIEFHAVRTRESGTRRFISLHVLVPGSWTISRGHQLVEELEREVRQTLSHASVFTHLEPLEDPVSQEDIAPVSYTHLDVYKRQLDIGMATHDARGRAGHIREDGIKRPAIPPVGRGAAVGNPDLGDETEAAQVVFDAPGARGVDIECQQIDIGRFQQMSGFAPRRGASVEDALAGNGQQQLGSALRAGILDRHQPIGCLLYTSRCV